MASVTLPFPSGGSTAKKKVEFELFEGFLRFKNAIFLNFNLEFLRFEQKIRVGKIQKLEYSEECLFSIFLHRI